MRGVPVHTRVCIKLQLLRCRIKPIIVFSFLFYFANATLFAVRMLFRAILMFDRWGTLNDLGVYKIRILKWF